MGGTDLILRTCHIPGIVLIGSSSHTSVVTLLTLLPILRHHWNLVHSKHRFD